MVRKKRKIDFEKRKFMVLKSIVKEYLEKGAPVSSRCIARKYEFGLSPATIRNIMMDLEEEGYIFQPHISAGRIPTSSGFRVYVEELLHSPQSMLNLSKQFKGEFDSIDMGESSIIPVTTKILSRVTHYPSIAVTNLVDDLILKSFTLVPQPPHLILVVIVYQGGIVKTLLVKNIHELDKNSLIRIGNYLTETFSDMTMREIEFQLKKRIKEVRNELYKTALEIYTEISDEYQRKGIDPAEILINGELSIMEYPEFSDSEKVRRLLKVLREKEFILSVMEKAKENLNGTVLMGEEIGATDLDVAVIAGGFRGIMRGVIGIVGPLRMNYPEVIMALRMIVNRLNHRN